MLPLCRGDCSCCRVSDARGRNYVQISLIDCNYASMLTVKYVDGETPTVDVHYRKWNYDGPTAEIILMPQKQVAK